MKQTKILIAIIIILLAILGIGTAYYLGTQNKVTKQETPSSLPTATPIPTATPTIQPQPTKPEETTSIPSDWLTYKNSEYGFEISYPENYQAMDDEENLYGWPKGIVLFYRGGQSYNLAIEVWSTVSEYENKYKTQMDNLTVKKIGNQYITLLNVNGEEEVDQIIATFKITD